MFLILFQRPQWVMKVKSLNYMVTWLFAFLLTFLSSAAGKSTFVRLLEQYDKEWEVVPEPIARWCNVQSQHDEFEVNKF